MAVDDIGLGFIKVRFRRAFAGSTECTPHSDRFESCCARNKKEAHPKGELLYGGHILVKFELKADSISCRVRGMLCYLVSSIIGDDRRPSSFRR